VGRRPEPPIDRDKLRAAIRRLGYESVFNMLDDAIDLLPPAKLHRIVKRQLDPRSLRPEDENGRADLLPAVRAFEKASLAGEYYDSFDVDSRNFMQKSAGTLGWIAECLRLLDRCVTQARKAEPADVCRAFDIIFGLLDRIDEGRVDILFFADEAGAWQVGVDWEKVLPSWFKVLSATAGPQEYGERIVRLLEHHYGYGSAKMLAVARKMATPPQRRALGAEGAEARPPARPSRKGSPRPR
jgi:hypothetical protein